MRWWTLRLELFGSPNGYMCWITCAGLCTHVKSARKDKDTKMVNIRDDTTIPSNKDYAKPYSCPSLHRLDAAANDNNH